MGELLSRANYTLRCDGWESREGVQTLFDMFIAIYEIALLL
jgi:hypothetical protein